jgi:hypothetical protein
MVLEAAYLDTLRQVSIASCVIDKLWTLVGGNGHERDSNETVDCVRHRMPSVVCLGDRLQPQETGQTGEGFRYDNPH